MRNLFLALLAILALGGPVYAEDVASARKHFERGSTLYDLQQFPEAAREYELAYEAKNDPALLFNIGQAYRYAGNYAKAIGAFKAFQRRMPNASNHNEVEARLAEMQKMLDEQKRTQDRPPGGIIEPAKPTVVEPAPEPPKVVAPIVVVEPPPQQRPRSNKPLLYGGIAVLAIGVAAIAAGGGLYAGALSAADEIGHPKPGTMFSSSTQDRMKTFEGASYAMFGVGAAAVITGAVLVAIGVKRGKASQQASILPSLAPGYAGVQAHVSF